MGSIEVKYGINNYAQHDTYAYLTGDEYPEPNYYPIVNAGIGTYAINMKISFGRRDSNILIGKYCSLAKDILFIMSDEHELNHVSTHPFQSIINIANSDVDMYADNELKKRCQVIIGHDVWIGMNATILGGIRIGTGAVIAAGSLVTKDVPPYTIVGGCPARVIRRRLPEDIAQKLLSIRWWNWPYRVIQDRLPNMEDPRAFVNQYYDEENGRLNSFPPTKRITDLKAENCRIYYLLADIGVKNPVWKMVAEQYLSLEKQDISLLCGVYEDVSQEDMEEFSRIMGSAENIVSVHRLKKNVIPCDIIPYVDTYITTRTIASLVMDYAADDVVWKSGLDGKIFEEI